MDYIDIAYEQLKRDEGVRPTVYRCTAGYLTVGVGHNLEAKPLSERAIRVIFEDDLKDAEADAIAVFGSDTFRSLDDARKAVLVNMAFNLGRDRLSGFKNFIAAVKARDWSNAAYHMLDSLWARQVGQRAWRLSEQMRTGEVK